MQLRLALPDASSVLISEANNPSLPSHTFSINYKYIQHSFSQLPDSYKKGIILDF